jgi:hypothetical protein
MSARDAAVGTRAAGLTLVASDETLSGSDVPNRRNMPALTAGSRRVETVDDLRPQPPA